MTKYQISTPLLQNRMQNDTQVVVFVWKKHARHVQLAADFTNWQPIDMWYHDFLWETKQALNYGLHRFKFVVDGKWTHDQDLPIECDEEGNINNTILVTPKSPMRPIRR